MIGALPRLCKVTFLTCSLLTEFSDTTSNKGEGPLGLFDSLVNDGKLQHDPHQRRIVQDLHKLYVDLNGYTPGPAGLISKVRCYITAEYRATLHVVFYTRHRHFFCIASVDSRGRRGGEKEKICWEWNCISCLRHKNVKSYTLFKTENPENDTLTGGTSLHTRKYMGVPSPPPPPPSLGVDWQVAETTQANNAFLNRLCILAFCSCLWLPAWESSVERWANCHVVIEFTEYSSFHRQVANNKVT